MKKFLVTFAAAAMPVAAQCVMCFRTAAAQQAERTRVLNLGIIILMIPPLMILTGVTSFCSASASAVEILSTTSMPTSVMRDFLLSQMAFIEPPSTSIFCRITGSCGRLFGSICTTTRIRENV